jgi:choline transport protein
MISYLSLVSATCYVAGTMIQGLLILNYPDYNFQNWHGTLLFYAVLFFSLFVNTYLGRLLPQIESLLLFFHILGFFAILIPIVYLAPAHQPASVVFGTFINNGEWSSIPLAIFVGLITATNAFPGMKTKF